MFIKIASIIEKLLQDNLELPKKSISTKKLTLEEKTPSIYINNSDFEALEAGIGNSMIEDESITTDVFSGDDEKTEFTLSKKPLRPILSVENPTSYKINPKNYKIDYNKGIIQFKISPKKGKNNLFIKYRTPYETKGLKLNLKYHIIINAGDESERDDLAIKIIETVIKNEENFTAQKMNIKLLRGFNLNPRDDVKDTSYVKILEYLIETSLKVTTPHPRMEEIEIKKINKKD